MEENMAEIIPYKLYELLAQQLIDDYGITQGRCLEVGTGKGMIGIEIAKRSNLHAYLLDISDEALTTAENRSREAGLLPRISVIKSPVEQLPFIDNYFDLIVSRGSMWFWNDKPAGLKEIYRVLKRGGIAYVGGGASRYMPDNERQAFFEKVYSQRRKEEADFDKVRSPEYLREVLSEAGINIYRLITDSGNWIEMKK